MPKNITPENRWETEFQVPLPGEPRTIGPLETLFQRLLNRTERLKNRIGAILGLSWDATPPDTLAGLAGRVGTLESNQGGTTLAAHRTNPVLDHPDGSVTSVKIANGAVTTTKIGDGAVTTVKLANGAVTAAKIEDGTVGTAKLADGAVTTPKIANSAVTTAKIADGAVTVPKLANVSADPTPNALVLRNAQGGVEEGAVYGAFRVQKLGGIYQWLTGNNKWVPIVKWTGFSGNWKGLFANLRITRLFESNIGTRLRVKVGTDGTGTFYRQAISIAHDGDAIATNAVLAQTDSNTLELWAFIPVSGVYVHGAVGTNIGTIEITPYGDVGSIVQDSPPSPISGGFYLEWNEVPVAQTFVGPGNIVAAARTATGGYIRYDNGIQIVWGTASIGSGTWTFPAAFASTPQVQATAQDTAPRLVTITSVSTTGVGLLRTDLSGNTQAGNVHLWAIGLWK